MRVALLTSRGWRGAVRAAAALPQAPPATPRTPEAWRTLGKVRDVPARPGAGVGSAAQGSGRRHDDTRRRLPPWGRGWGRRGRRRCKVLPGRPSPAPRRRGAPGPAGSLGANKGAARPLLPPTSVPAGPAGSRVPAADFREVDPAARYAGERGGPGRGTRAPRTATPRVPRAAGAPAPLLVPEPPPPRRGPRGCEPRAPSARPALQIWTRAGSPKGAVLSPVASRGPRHPEL